MNAIPKGINKTDPTTDMSVRIDMRGLSLPDCPQKTIIVRRISHRIKNTMIQK